MRKLFFVYKLKLILLDLYKTKVISIVILSNIVVLIVRTTSEDPYDHIMDRTILL